MSVHGHCVRDSGLARTPAARELSRRTAGRWAASSRPDELPQKVGAILAFLEDR